MKPKYPKTLTDYLEVAIILAAVAIVLWAIAQQFVPHHVFSPNLPAAAQHKKP